MIIVALMKLIKGFLSLLLVFNLPSMPDAVQNVMLQVADTLGDGISVLRAFIGAEAMSVIATLFGVVAIVETAYFLYTAVMWILAKLPMLNISK